jgi:phosphate uptake regulator
VLIRRKITSLGKYSLIVTLPKNWVEMNNLSKGKTVSLTIEKDGSLVIHPSLEVIGKQKEITLFFDSENDINTIYRSVIGCYLNGYNKIQLKSKKIFSVEQQTAIRKVVRSLYMRVLESTVNKVVLQVLMDESLASVNSGIERMHIITSSMCKDILKAMKEWDSELTKSVISLEEDVDQFMYFLLRLIRSAAINPSLANQLNLDMIDCLDYQTLVHRIEHVADHVTAIAESIVYLFDNRLFLPSNVFSVLIKSAEIAFNSYDIAVQSFLSKTVENINKIIDQQIEIEKLGETITPLPFFGEREEKPVLCQICTIRDSIKRISEYAADIAELTIDRTYRA